MTCFLWFWFGCVIAWSCVFSFVGGSARVLKKSYALNLCDEQRFIVWGEELMSYSSEALQVAFAFNPAASFVCSKCVEFFPHVIALCRNCAWDGASVRQQTEVNLNHQTQSSAPSLVFPHVQPDKTCAQELIFIQTHIFFPLQSDFFFLKTSSCNTAPLN